VRVCIVTLVFGRAKVVQHFFGTNDSEKALGELFDELRHLVVDYVKQETLEPARGLGRVLAISVASGLCLGIGFVLVLFGLLRFLQEEVWVFPEGSVTWLPYILTALVGGIILSVLGMSISKGSESATSDTDDRG